LVKLRQVWCFKTFINLTKFVDCDLPMLCNYVCDYLFPVLMHLVFVVMLHVMKHYIYLGSWFCNTGIPYSEENIYQILILCGLCWCRVWLMSLVFIMPNLICSHNTFLCTHLSFGKIHYFNLSVLYFELCDRNWKTFTTIALSGFALVVKIDTKQKHLWCSAKIRFWHLILAVKWRYKVKLFLSMPCRHIGRISDIAHSVLNAALDRGECQLHILAPLPQGRNPWYEMNRRQGGLQSQSGFFRRKISCPHQELNPRLPSL
jgi:hypothetical protein